MQEVVIVIIQNESGEFLSLKRAKGRDDGIVWGFPSGKVDSGETQEDAVIREVYEETGIICKPSEIIAERIVANNKLIYWTAKFLQGIPRDPLTGETSDVAFRSVNELLKLIPVSVIHSSVKRELGIQDVCALFVQTLEMK